MLIIESIAMVSILSMFTTTSEIDDKLVAHNQKNNVVAYHQSN